MEIEIQIDKSRKEPKLIILTDKMSPQVSQLLQHLSEEQPEVLAGFQDGRVVALEQEEIFRIYASAGKVYAATQQGEFLLRLRLYELEERLSRSRFVRISNSEIINLKKVKNFDLSFAGTICVTLKDSTVTYVSRRYVAGIKERLGI